MNSNTTKHNELLRRAHSLLMQELEQLDHTDPLQSISALRDRLIEIRRTLAEHFRLEETSGYFDVIRNRRPGLEHDLQRFVNEHKELLQSLNDLLAQISVPQASKPAAREQVRIWLEHVHAHESHENELIQDAFLTDVGVGD